MNNKGRTTIKYAVPKRAYKLQIDSDGSKYWSESLHILAYQNNEVELELRELTATNNPHPIRYDGVGPIFTPTLAALGDVDPLFGTAIVGDPRTYYFISDHLGTGQLLVDTNQQVVWQANYTPFGTTTITIDQVSNNFRFPGQYYDAKTGLHYNWHRFYDPETGRYISADPIGLFGGLNLYSYVGGDPVNAVDPTGLYTYNGYCRYISGGIRVGVGVLRCKIWTECVDGKRQSG